MKYLKLKSIGEIYDYPNLRAKYNITKVQVDVEDLLFNHINNGNLVLPNRPPEISIKRFEKFLNECKLMYLKSLPEATDEMIDYFTVNYIENKNLHYHPLNHKYKHIIIFNNGQDWVRTIHISRNNAITKEDVKGILTQHNHEYIFITKTTVYKCTPTYNKIGKYKEVVLGDILINLI